MVQSTSSNLRLSNCEEVLLYSGIDPDLTTRPELTKYPKESAAWNSALDNLKKPYNEYRKNLEKLTCNQFLVRVEKSLTQLESAKAKVSTRLPAVANKLQEVAQKRMKEEKSFSWIYKIFHKIGQLFKGRGFRTEGQWAEALAKRLEKRNENIYKDQVAAWLLEGVALDPDIREQLIDKVGKLSKDDFCKLLDLSVFKRCNPGRKDAGVNKNMFYSLIGSERRGWFFEHLLERDDWVPQLLDLAVFEETSEGSKMRFPYEPKLVDKVVKDCKRFIDACGRLDLQNPRVEKFLLILFAYILKVNIDSENNQGLRDFLGATGEHPAFKHITPALLDGSADVSILTPAHKEYLLQNKYVQ